MVMPVTHPGAEDSFLRAAIKTGLKLQRDEASERGGTAKSGVATLQRIKASLRKRKSNIKPIH